MLNKNDLEEIGKLIAPIAKDVKDVKKRVKKLEKTVDVMVNQFDIRLTKLERKAHSSTN